jgi:hypothetical protein
MRSVLSRPLVGLLAGLALAGFAGCTNDPLYIPGPMTMEAGIDMMGMRSQATASLPLPIKTETARDQMARAALEAELGVAVPYVRLGDIEVSVEWTIRNLDSMPGTALIQLNGANDAFAYDPSILILDPEEDDPPPGLEGDVPIHVPASGEISGLFTEDDLREASIDLDQITRGNVNPFRAILTISKNAKEFQPLTPPMPLDPDYEQQPVGVVIPRAAFRQMIRIDLVFKPDRHMVLEYNVRVRDIRGIMHDLLLTAMTETPEELQTFDPVPYTAMAMP